MAIILVTREGEMSDNFHLCQEGWELYHELDEALADGRDGVREWEKYIEHRKECEKCTKPKEEER